MSVRPMGFALLLLLLCGAANAAGPVQSLVIKLQDSSVDPALAHMRMVLDHDTLKPGRVTFEATNESKGLVHEVIVVRDKGVKELPYDAKMKVVVEKSIQHLGEISDLPPGKSGKLTLDLKAGTYLLICNQPGHYKDGMSAKVTVAP
jgi:uncharacterized cupredoxin-like copper-binding protein